MRSGAPASIKMMDPSFSSNEKARRSQGVRMDSVRRPMAIVIAVLRWPTRLATTSFTRGAMAPIVQETHLHTK